MDIDAIIAQLADNDEAARTAYRALPVAAPAKPAAHRPRHSATEMVRVEDGFAVYANVKF